MSERRFVVEVTRPVPTADVGGVSARIAQRLDMDPQRIHTLLHGRMGPVTKPVLPDKAAAIAEVFAAAGVQVAVLPVPDVVVPVVFAGPGEEAPEEVAPPPPAARSVETRETEGAPDGSADSHESAAPAWPPPTSPAAPARPSWDDSSAWADDDAGDWGDLRPRDLSGDADAYDQSGGHDRPDYPDDEPMAAPDDDPYEAQDHGDDDEEAEADRLGPRRDGAAEAVFTTSTRWVPSPHDEPVSDDDGPALGAEARSRWGDGRMTSAGRGMGAHGTPVPDEPWQPAAPREGPRLRSYLVWSLVVSIAVFLLLQLVMANRVGSGPEPSAFDRGLEAFRRGDFRAAARELGPEAEAGNASAQYYLGYMAQNGLGEPWSNAKAAAHYRRAAEAGMPEAQLALGDLYIRGMGVEQDSTVGASWYARAAAAGYPQGQYAYGKLLLHGTGVPRDPVAALAQFEAAAAAGLATAADYVAFAAEAVTEHEPAP